MEYRLLLFWISTIIFLSVYFLALLFVEIFLSLIRDESRHLGSYLPSNRLVIPAIVSLHFYKAVYFFLIKMHDYTVHVCGIVIGFSIFGYTETYPIMMNATEAA